MEFEPDDVLRCLRCCHAEYAECLDHLDASLGVNGDCDVLHRYRSRAYNHLGKYDSAKRDADKAVALNPRSAPNLLVQGQCLQQVKKNS